MSKLDDAMTAYAVSRTEANRLAIVDAVAPELRAEIATLKDCLVQREQSLIEAKRRELAGIQEFVAYIDSRPRSEDSAAPTAQPEQAKPTNLQAPDWVECTSISDLPLVDDALRAFSDDSTADNATGLIKVILEAAQEAKPTEARELTDAEIEEIWLEAPTGDRPHLTRQYFARAIARHITPSKGTL